MKITACSKVLCKIKNVKLVIIIKNVDKKEVCYLKIYFFTQFDYVDFIRHLI